MERLKQQLAQVSSENRAVESTPALSTHSDDSRVDELESNLRVLKQRISSLEVRITSTKLPANF